MSRNKPHDEFWLAAKEISNQLGETEQGPRFQVARLVRHAGIEFAQNVLKDTLEMEAQGGLMLPDNSRRRTPGGVFFYLARTRLEPKLRRKIFFVPRADVKTKQDQQQATESTAPEPDRPTFDWKDRLGIIESLRVEQGEISTVKVTLIGRPGKIEIRKDLVITTMVHMAKTASFPKGVPAPPSTPTLYTVYIGLKQWRKVEESIANAEDMLIVEGMSAFDPEIQAIAVYVTGLSTKLLDAKKREAQKPSTEATGETPAPKQQAQKQAQGNKTGGSPAPMKLPKVDDMVIPAGMPADEVQKLKGLYASAALFRQKIATIQAKPVEQRSGLEMTQKLLKGVEDQIAVLVSKHS